MIMALGVRAAFGKVITVLVSVFRAAILRVETITEALHGPTVEGGFPVFVVRAVQTVGDVLVRLPGDQRGVHAVRAGHVVLPAHFRGAFHVDLVVLDAVAVIVLVGGGEGVEKEE